MVPVNAISHANPARERKSALLLLVVFLTIALGSFGQFQPTPVKKSNNHITISGKNYYLHEVLKGQTLFGISKEYQVSEDEIKLANPELSKKPVTSGMVLRIPEPDTTATQAGKEAQTYVTHKVLPKENLYSISRQYGVRVDDIRELNPDTRTGLRTGQLLKIPKDKITLTQNAPAANPKTTRSDAVATDTSSESDKAEPRCKVKPFPHQDENFRLAILLPLNIDQNDTLTYTDTLKAEHFRFYEFLEGVYLALDSMRLEGLNMTVEVFDTQRDPATIKRLIDNDKLNQADLIIGPIFKNEIDLVSEFSKSHHIPMVSPLSNFDVVKGNPYAFQVRNNLVRQNEIAAAWAGSKYNQNIVVIGRLSERKDSDFTKFTANLGIQLKEHDPARKATFKTVYFSEVSRSFLTADSVSTNLGRSLSTTGQNLIILPSESEVFITEVINQLQEKSLSYNLHVFGLNQWVFSNLDLGNLYNLNLELYSDFEEYPFIDYTNPVVTAFCRKYKDNWNIEPSRYSFQGFDIAYFFSRALFQFGSNLPSTVPCWTEYLTHPSMLTPIRFQGNGPANGFSNQALTVVRYQKEELVRKKVN
jgi:LysM repeat protein